MHLSLASQALLLIPFPFLISPMVLGFFSAPSPSYHSLQGRHTHHSVLRRLGFCMFC